LISRSILSNYLGSGIGLSVSKGLRFLGIVLCVRMVGYYTWGQVVSTLAIFSFVNFVIDQGLSGAPLLFHLQNRAADKRLWFLISMYRLATACLLIALLYLIHAFIHPLDKLILLYSFVLIPRALGIEWLFHRRELYQVILYIGSIRTALFFLCVLLFVRSGVSAERIVLIEMVSEAASIALGYLIRGLGRLHGEKTEVPQFGIRELLVFSFPFLIVGVLNNVQLSADVLFLRFLRGNEMVALYDIGSKIGFLYFFLGATIIQIIKPKLTRLYQGNDVKRMGAILRMTSAILLLLSTVFLIPSFYFSSELIGLLFRSKQPLTVFVFRWAAVWVTISFMNMLCSDTLLSLGRRKDYVRGALICALSNIGATLLLITLFSGYGVIFGRIIAEAVFLIVCFFRIPSEIRREISASLFLQVSVLAGFLALYSGSILLGHRFGWLGVSVAGCLLIGFFGKVFTRETLALLRDN